MNITQTSLKLTHPGSLKSNQALEQPQSVISTDDCGCSGPQDKVQISDSETKDSFGQKVVRFGGKAGRIVGGTLAGAILSGLGTAAGMLLGGLYVGTLIGPLASISLHPGDRTPLLTTKEAPPSAEQLSRTVLPPHLAPLPLQLLDESSSLAADFAWQFSSPVRWGTELAGAGFKNGWQIFNP